MICTDVTGAFKDASRSSETKCCLDTKTNGAMILNERLLEKEEWAFYDFFPKGPGIFCINCSYCQKQAA